MYALRASLCVGAEQITKVTWQSDYPQQKELSGFRSPGTSVPFLFQAGSFFYKKKREFRYLKLRQRGQLVIKTNLNKYSVIRLSLDEATAFDIVQWFNDVKSKRKLA